MRNTNISNKHMKKKKLFCAGLAVTLCGGMLKAQSLSSIYGTPDKYQGFIIMDNVSNPNIKTWEVEVFSKTLEVDSSITEKTIEKTITTNPYLRLNRKYYTTPGTYVRVFGMDAGGRSVSLGTYTPFPNTMANLPYYIPKYSQGCVCDSYALNIWIDAHYDTQNNLISGSMLEVDAFPDHDSTIQPFNQTVYIPHYQYMSQKEYDHMRRTIQDSDTCSNSVLNPLSLAHHGITGYEATKVSMGFCYGISIRKINNYSGNGYQTYQGTNITTQYVYAAQKAMGPYEANAYLESDHLAEDAQSLAGELSNYDGYRLYANQYIDSLVPNPLDPCDGGDSGENDGCDVATVAEAAENSDSFVDVIFAIMESDCLPAVFWNPDGEDTGGSTGAGVVWPNASVTSFQLYKISQPIDNGDGKIGGLVAEFYRDSLLNSDLKSVISNLLLEDGLYNLVLGMDKQEVLPIIFEFSKKPLSSTKQADSFSTNIYPMPFNDNITIEMEATGDLNFSYKVYDILNRDYFHGNYDIDKGTEKLININTSQWPGGIFFHKFVFQDGSQKVITSMKTSL